MLKFLILALGGYFFDVERNVGQCNVTHPAMCIDSRIEFECFLEGYACVACVEFLFEND
jgi:hypothetical protein